MANQNDDRKMVSFTRESLVRFKNRYEQTVTLNNDTFEFEDNVYVVGYAKYLIEYLESGFAASDGSSVPNYG